MGERLWAMAPKEIRPEDKKITSADVEEWNHEISEASGFPDMVPEEFESDVFFYIGVGRNKNDDIVGAVPLSMAPVNYEEKSSVKERRELMLKVKAKKIFGLIPKGNLI